MDTSSDNSFERYAIHRVWMAVVQEAYLNVLKATEVLPYRVVSPEEVAELRASHVQRFEAGIR